MLFKNIDNFRFLTIIIGALFIFILNFRGGVAEWSKAAVLKTVDVQASVGSNPTSSANIFVCGEVTERLKVLAC